MRATSLIAVFAAAVVIPGYDTGGDAAAAKPSFTADNPGRDNPAWSSRTSQPESDRLAAALAGKRGDGLVAALRRECRPVRLNDFPTVFDGMSMTDPFTGAEERVDGSITARALSIAPIVPSQWWTDRTQGADCRYGDTVARDLHNLTLIPSVVKASAGTYPPGVPENVTASHGAWRQGTVSLSGIGVMVNEPAESQRGRVARAYLYMALMYPQSAMAPEGLMVLADGGPSLNEYWRTLLLQWHSAYPPTAREKECAELAAKAQGGCNPLIELPEIADFIWGDKRSEVYRGEGVADSEVPLHGTYALTEHISLTSPHIPDDAVWSIDGRSVNERNLPARSLGSGVHHLEYVSEASGERGRVKITVTN